MKFERRDHDIYEGKCLVAQKNIRPPFENQEDVVNKTIDELNVYPVAMQGVYDDLLGLKEALDNIIGTTEYYYLDYELGEVGYHWPSTPENIEKVANMRKILHGVQEHMMIAYAYILGGLGKKLDDGKRKIY